MVQGEKSMVQDTASSRKNGLNKNCGTPPGNEFDLRVGQRSRSPHGTNGKGLS